MGWDLCKTVAQKGGTGAVVPSVRAVVPSCASDAFVLGIKLQCQGRVVLEVAEDPCAGQPALLKNAAKRFRSA